MLGIAPAAPQHPVAPRGAPLGATTLRAQKCPVAPQGLPQRATWSYCCADVFGQSIAFSNSTSSRHLSCCAEAFGQSRAHTFAIWVSRLASWPACPRAAASAVVVRLRHLDDAADVGDGLASGDQRLGGPLPEQPPFWLELADDLLRCVPGGFHGGVPGPVWPAEVSHSPCCGFRGPRQHQS
jgi:hypothetical protein